MKNHPKIHRTAPAAIALLVILSLAGCQSGMLSFQGRVVRPENRLFFPDEGTRSGAWQTRDMTIDYQLARKPEGVHLTGTLHWANHILYNFTDVRINLRANFFDEQDTITGGQGIPLLGFVNLRNSTAQFNVLLNTSPADKGFAFSYSGRALVVALAAPVEVGTRLAAPALPLLSLLLYPSTIPWLEV